MRPGDDQLAVYTFDLHAATRSHDRNRSVVRHVQVQVAIPVYIRQRQRCAARLGHDSSLGSCFTETPTTVIDENVNSTPQRRYEQVQIAIAVEVCEHCTRGML